MAEVLVDPEFHGLIPKLRDDEWAGLEASILAEGCRDALVAWRNGRDVLLDGHNRLQICQAHGIPFEIKALEFPTREHAKLWILENQLFHRRNLTDDQRAMIAVDVVELRSKLAVAKARQKQAEAGKLGGRGHKKTPEDNASSGVSTSPQLRTRAAVAKEEKLPERKVRIAAEVKRAAPDLAKKVSNGEMSLADAKRTVKRAAIVERLESTEAKQAKELAGLYDVVVIDPPWPVEKIERDERPNQLESDYPLMSLEEIADQVGARLGQHLAADSHVFLWTTQKYLPAAFELAARWGLKYICTFVWHKPGGFQPFGLPQYNCEFALYLRKGAPSFIETKSFPVCFEAARRRHSEKPEQFYAMLRRTTAGRRLDMFNRRQIEGFDGWGNEA